MIERISVRTILLLYIVFSISVLGYNWPLDVDNNPSNGYQNGQSEVIGTLAECREDRDHFHSGVDITAADNERVYTVSSGKAELGNISITVGKFRYTHVDNFRFRQGEQVPNQTWVAQIDGDHLHFMESSTDANSVWINPLRSGALTPFVDTTSPVIESVDFWKQGTNEELTGPLYGKIDLRVDTYDPRTSENGANAGCCCGIYKLKIEIWKDGERIGNRIERHIYDSRPTCAVSLIYAAGSSNNNFLYWATNDPFNAPHNKYLNTKQKKDSPDDVDALIPSEAMYGEGNMQILVIAEDIRGNADTMRLGQQ